ncbi:sigma-70 family RNA polymerase sigma factor [Rapidithrix thailandica]|uniref:Sigma-70 family RNA polymerase sigma factor n=1 Tax=Rapidithrix thailandica TaxID=413964 RepID=A0AAW9SAS2_9BACT
MSKATSLGEQSLWEQFKEGDSFSFDNLYRNYSSMLYAYGIKIIPEPSIVEDVIHDLFVELWQRKTQLPTPENIKFYLLRALRNKLFKVLNKRTDLSIDDQQAFPLEISQEAMIIQEENHRQLHRELQNGLNQLTKRQREILYLKFNEDMSYQEIANVTQMNYQSVVNTIYRAIQTLRSQVKLPTAILLLLLSQLH